MNKEGKISQLSHYTSIHPAYKNRIHEKVSYFDVNNTKSVNRLARNVAGGFWPTRTAKVKLTNHNQRPASPLLSSPPAFFTSCHLPYFSPSPQEEWNQTATRRQSLIPPSSGDGTQMVVVY
ncbi:hypothetical protein ACTXT7_004118 [Hymenolepis weldensis]